MSGPAGWWKGLVGSVTARGGAFLGAAFANVAVNAIANAFGKWIDGDEGRSEPITVDALEQMAVTGRPVLTELLGRMEEMDPQARDGLRMALRELAPKLGPTQFDQILDSLADLDGGRFQPWVEVFDRHSDWYEGQMEQARQAMLA